MQQIKNCSMCKKTKSLLEFWFRKDQNNYRANCKECCSKLRKKYYKKNKKTLLIWHKKYRLVNRDKIIKQQKESYYKNNGAEKRKEWRNKNPLRDKKTNRKWRLNNPKKILKIAKERWQKIINDPILHEKNKLQVRLKMSTLKAKLRQRKSFKKHFLANKEYYLKKNRNHYLNNKLYYNLKSLHRTKHILMRTPKWANLEKIREIYQNRKKGYHVDHIIPLQGENVSGLHVENNLQYLTTKQNLSKGNKYFE